MDAVPCIVTVAGGGRSPEFKSVAIAAASPSSSKKNSPSKGSGGGSLVVCTAGGGPAPASGSSPSNKGPLSFHGSKTLLSINGTDNNSIVSGAAGATDGVQQASPTSSAHLALLEGQGLDAGSSLTTIHEGSWTNCFKASKGREGGGRRELRAAGLHHFLFADGNELPCQGRLEVASL